ncbi:MAG TPA: ester cyclase [Acidimicrobiia bacterium]|nr:ester cyclase [Acidimicrobiia bacterium]
MDNKAIVRRFVEEYQSQGDETVADEILADDFVDHSPFGPFPPDREGVKQLFAALRRAFSDLHAVVQDQAAEGDKVWTRKTFHGTNDGEFMGMPPTGKKVSFDVIDILRLRDRQFVEHWNVVDNLGLMQQLGAVPAPA